MAEAMDSCDEEKVVPGVNVDVRAPCDGGGAVEVPHQVQNPLLDLLTDALAGPVNCVIYGANDISNHKPAGMQ